MAAVSRQRAPLKFQTRTHSIPQSTCSYAHQVANTAAQAAHQLAHPTCLERRILRAATKEACLRGWNRIHIPVSGVFIHTQKCAKPRPSTNRDDVAELGRVILAKMGSIIRDWAHSAPHVTVCRPLPLHNHKWAVRAIRRRAPTRPTVVVAKQCLRCAIVAIDLPMILAAGVACFVIPTVQLPADPH